jgi:hypothetical protein
MIAPSTLSRTHAKFNQGPIEPFASNGKDPQARCNGIRSCNHSINRASTGMGSREEQSNHDGVRATGFKVRNMAVQGRNCSGREESWQRAIASPLPNQVIKERTPQPGHAPNLREMPCGGYTETSRRPRKAEDLTLPVGRSPFPGEIRSPGNRLPVLIQVIVHPYSKPLVPEIKTITSLRLTNIV